MPALLVRVLLTLLAAASFLATSSWIRSQLGPDGEDEPAEKLEYLYEHAPGHTAVLFGTSTMLFGIDPRIVNPIVQEVEPDFRLINAAVSGMIGYEARGFMEEVLETPGFEPRWVLEQARAWMPIMDPTMADTLRTQDWHDLTQSLRATTAAMESEAARKSTDRNWARFHLTKFVHRLGNYGQGKRLWAGLMGVPREPRFPEGRLEETGGYATVEEVVGQVGVRNSRKLLDRLDEFRKAREQLKTPYRWDVPDFRVRYNRETRRWLEGRGHEVLYFDAPYVFGQAWAPKVEDQGELPGLMHFMDPVRYPELYEIENRFDPQHFNVDGAEVFSRLFAEAIVERLRASASR